MRQTIVVESSVNAEALTINRYRCLGWELVNNQEVAVSHTNVTGQYNGYQTNVSSSTTVERYVKLTFERDTDSPNFEVFDNYYKQYCALEYQKKSIYAEANAELSNKSIARNFLIAALPGILGAFAIMKAIAGDHDFDFMLIVFSLMTAVGAVIAIGASICAIESMLLKSKIKKSNIPAQIADIEAKIDVIVAESAKYI